VKIILEELMIYEYFLYQLAANKDYKFLLKTHRVINTIILEKDKEELGWIGSRVIEVIKKNDSNNKLIIEDIVVNLLEKKFPTYIINTIERKLKIKKRQIIT
jgi:hypothetical protein